MLKLSFRKKRCFLLILLISSFTYSTYGIDPFSHIKITSNKATCQKNNTDSHAFIFNYIEKVNVTLADGSKITSDYLEIILDGKSINLDAHQSSKHENGKNAKNNSLSNVKKITFKNNVYISNKNREARSDSATINLLENTCLLDGNVKIKQLKGTQNDIPLNVESTQALINLKSSEVTLLGSHQTPVSTTIELSKNILSSSKKSHTK